MRSALRPIMCLPILCMLVAANGCLIEGQSEVVLTKDICVWFDEDRDQAQFISEVICDLYAQAILNFLAENDVDPEDVTDVMIVGGTYKTAMLTETRDWIMEAKASVRRQDNPQGPVDDGPAQLMSFTEQSLREARGPAVEAPLVEAGVELLERAVLAFLQGENPRVVVTLEMLDVEPDVTPQDPLQFKHRICAQMQFVVWTDLN